MGKQIVVQSKNGAENIRLSRLATRQSNLEEDRIVWKMLANNPCSQMHPVYKTNESGRRVKDPNYAHAMKVGTTISQRIVTRYADMFDVHLEENVTTEMIREMAKRYLSWDEVAQLLVCRDPSRQSIDEEVQIATLRKYLVGFSVEKPLNGELTLIEGTMVKKPKKTNRDVRSVDIVVKNNNKEFLTFAKYSAVAGSGQSHQALESLNFVKEAIKYVEKNQDGKYFLVLMDGAEAESHIPELNNLTKKYPTIFAGNCENVINFIKRVK